MTKIENVSVPKSRKPLNDGFPFVFLGKRFCTPERASRGLWGRLEVPRRPSGSFSGIQGGWARCRENPCRQPLYIWSSEGNSHPVAPETPKPAFPDLHHTDLHRTGFHPGRPWVVGAWPRIYTRKGGGTHAGTRQDPKVGPGSDSEAATGIGRRVGPGIGPGTVPGSGSPGQGRGQTPGQVNVTGLVPDRCRFGKRLLNRQKASAG